ncbi:MAG: helix-turn-helix domain-containing protein [Candidatus Ornithomonoglobus sp.]
MVPFYEFQPSDINVIHNTRELRYRAHIHKQIELIYVFKLGQHINIDGKEYEIREGEAAVIFPNTIHTYYRNEWRNTDQVFVIASTDIFGSILPDFEECSSENPIITDIDEVTVTAFKEITDCADPAEKLALTLLIISKLIKKLKLSHSGAAPVKNLTQKIITYIGENFRNDITLDLLAKEFSVSKFYISHTFSEKIKISLPNYLALIRAEYAAGLIRTTNDSITNICNNSGFTSQSTFNRAFKRIYCMTPREYKANIGELYKAD